MRTAVPSTDVLLVVMGAPHEGELVTSLFRLVHALAERGSTVQVWTCGYASMLSQDALGTIKPVNVLDRHRTHPTTSTVVRSLLETFPERVYWYGCRTCSEHRGTTGHIPEVPMRRPHRFAEHVRSATKVLYMGTS